MSLLKGGNLELPVDLEIGGYLDLVLSVPSSRTAPDVFVILADQSGRALGDSSIVFFNNPVEPSGSVSLIAEDTSVGARIRLNRVPPNVASVFVAITAEHPIAALGSTVRITDGSGRPITDFTLTGLTSEDTVVMAEVYRRLGHWRVRAVSQGWSQGVAALLTSYGVTVDDEPDSTPVSNSPSHPVETPVTPQPPAPPPPSATAPAATTRVSIPEQPAAHSEFAPAPGWPSPPVGWRPSSGWQPDPSWPAPPPHWQFWITEPAQPPAPGVPYPSVPVPATAPGPVRRGGLFGGRRSDLQAEVTRLTDLLNQTGGLDLVEVQTLIAQRRAELQMLNDRIATTRAELTLFQGQLASTEVDLQTQEAGLYTYTHPLDDSAAYKARLADIKDELKHLVTAGAAITAVQQWTVNGSVREGTAMVRDFSKLMLRAYNAEADSAVRTVKPHTRRSAQDKLSKARETIARLGKTMSIRVGDRYHELRLREIALTAEYRAKVEEEREAARLAREEQREAEKADREFRRELDKLEREQQHYRTALQRGTWSDDAPERQELLAKLDEIGDAIVGVEQRQANIRAGYVYVISNVGAFGQRMVKIGLTRRLEPMDRVRELGDASVPFRFDVHALIFSHDAVTLENQLHRTFETRKVNAVNPRREFFYATPTEVRDALASLDRQYLLEFREEPDAEEFRMSPPPPASAATGY